MTCEHVPLPGGGAAIVCSGRRGRRCGCGRRETLLCDWKVPGKPLGTCDAPLCRRCTTSPAPGKDLCPDHARAWRARLAERPETGAAHSPEAVTR